MTTSPKPTARSRREVPVPVSDDDPRFLAPGERRFRPLHVVLAVLVVAMAAMWVYVLFLAPDEYANKIDDKQFLASAEQVCARADAELALLPSARTAKVPQDRAPVLDKANARLETMVAELAALPYSLDAKQAFFRESWLKDWGTYLGDRRAHTEKLRAGQDPQFAETPVPGKGTPTSVLIDYFAEKNGMPSCKVPNDIA